MTVFEQAVDALRRMLAELEQSAESGVAGVDVVVKHGKPHFVNRKLIGNGEPAEKPVEKRQRFGV